MMATRFEVGDVVRLRSGGPSMTVVAVDLADELVGLAGSPTQPTYSTAWFAGAKRDGGGFPEAALVAVADDEPTGSG